MKYRIPPKVAMINSFAGYGRCSTTEVVPILSAMKVQVCPCPHRCLFQPYRIPFLLLS